VVTTGMPQIASGSSRVGSGVTARRRILAAF
jgi:hypothetical protein